jgi:hypothetical protein
MKAIVTSLLPIAFMVMLVPLIKNDQALLWTYVVIIWVLFSLKHERGEIRLLLIGAVVMFLFELLFISTGVETFERNSLFGMMPIWLPVLWGFGFVQMKRFIKAMRY